MAANMESAEKVTDNSVAVNSELAGKSSVHTSSDKHPLVSQHAVV